MKKLAFVLFCGVIAVMFSACQPEKTDSYKVFVGTWGVEKIEYYNIDYAGQPIAASMMTFNLIPGDPDSGIDLIFRDNKTGEMRDRSQDTLWLDFNPETEIYETIIICPDTTLVKTFTYSYDEDASILYMNMPNANTFMMQISDLTDNSFTYVNEYEEDYVEKAYLKRLSETPASKSSRKNTNQKRPHMPGSFLSGR